MTYTSSPDAAISRALAGVQSIYDIVSERTMTRPSEPLQRYCAVRARKQLLDALAALDEFEATLSPVEAPEPV